MAEPKMPSTALVTGAASGIGREMARECASLGIDLVLVDLNADGIAETERQIRGQYDRKIHSFVVNLAERGAPERCLAFCDENNIQIDLLINDAGIFIFDPLVRADPKRVAVMCDLHVYCVTRMCMLFGSRMADRKFGYILNVSSMSAWMAMPGINVYNASKSYVRSLSRSLYFELKPHNVGVTAVCPGGINTSLFGLSDKLRKLACNLGILMSPEKLAHKAIKAALKRKIQTIPGVINHVFVFFMRLIPQFLVFFIMKRLAVYKKFYELPPDAETPVPEEDKIPETPVPEEDKIPETPVPEEDKIPETPADKTGA